MVCSTFGISCHNPYQEWLIFIPGKKETLIANHWSLWSEISHVKPNDPNFWNDPSGMIQISNDPNSWKHNVSSSFSTVVRTFWLIFLARNVALDQATKTESLYSSWFSWLDQEPLFQWVNDIHTFPELTYELTFQTSETTSITCAAFNCILLTNIIRGMLQPQYCLYRIHTKMSNVHFITFLREVFTNAIL